MPHSELRWPGSNKRGKDTRLAVQYIWNSSQSNLQYVFLLKSYYSVIGLRMFSGHYVQAATADILQTNLYPESVSC